MLPKPRIRIDCTCHDPTVFGHLTCTRAETQPNNTLPPLPTSVQLPDPAYMTRISLDMGMTCSGVIYDEINRVNQHFTQLNAITRETAQYVEELATALYGEDMHYHENLEEMSACPRCAPRHG